MKSEDSKLEIAMPAPATIAPTETASKWNVVRASVMPATAVDTESPVTPALLSVS